MVIATLSFDSSSPPLELSKYRLETTIEYTEVYSGLFTTFICVEKSSPRELGQSRCTFGADATDVRCTSSHGGLHLFSLGRQDDTRKLASKALVGMVRTPLRSTHTHETQAHGSIISIIKTKSAVSTSEPWPQPVRRRRLFEALFAVPHPTSTPTKIRKMDTIQEVYHYVSLGPGPRIWEELSNFLYAMVYRRRSPSGQYSITDTTHIRIGPA